MKKYFKYTPAGDILFINRAFWQLGGDKKVLLFLAAVMGRKFLGLAAAEVVATNEAIERKLNMNENSVRVYVSQLRRAGLIVTEAGGHSITTQGLHDLMEEEK